MDIVPNATATRASTRVCDAELVDESFIAGYLTLLITCMASWKIASFVSDNQRALSLPRGSGFLLAGLMAGTFGMVKATAKTCQISVLSHPRGRDYDEIQPVFFPVRVLRGGEACQSVSWRLHTAPASCRSTMCVCRL